MRSFATYTITATIGVDEAEYQAFCHYVLLCYPYHSPIARRGNQITVSIKLDYAWGDDEDEFFNGYQEKGAIGKWDHRP